MPTPLHPRLAHKFHSVLPHLVISLSCTLQKKRRCPNQYIYHVVLSWFNILKAAFIIFNTADWVWASSEWTLCSIYVVYGTSVSPFYAPAEWTVPPFINDDGHDSIKYTLHTYRSFQNCCTELAQLGSVLRAALNIFNVSVYSSKYVF